MHEVAQGTSIRKALFMVTSAEYLIRKIAIYSN